MKITTIVLAKTEMTGLRDTGRLHRPDGVNWQPVFEACARPVACVWLNEGTESDIDKAKAYASQEGYRVFTFPVSEKDPLSKARKAAMAGKEKPVVY